MAETNNYDPIAAFYDDHWTDRYQPLAFDLLWDLLLKDLSPGSSILDVGCGTGIIAQNLVSNGYRVVGIDISPGMISAARRRLPEGDFRVADARTACFQEKFDAVISLFDTLNHILSLEEMLSVFRNIHSVLMHGGIFVFDLNMEEAYETQWNKWSAHIFPDEVCIVRGGYDPETRSGHTEITLFSKNSGWQRDDVLLKQRCYEEREIVEALHLAGFRETNVYAASKLGMRDADLAAGRCFFIAHV